MDKFIEDGAIVLGGVMHRFQHDRAVRAFCTEHGMTNPSITDNGEVWASYYEGGTEFQIGWIK